MLRIESSLLVQVHLLLLRRLGAREACRVVARVFWENQNLTFCENIDREHESGQAKGCGRGLRGEKGLARARSSRRERTCGVSVHAR